MSWKLMRDIAAPARHRLGVEDLQALQPEIAHPVRLVLHVGNLVDDFGVEPLRALKTYFESVRKSYLLISPI